jgi:hypothetical protein
MMMRFEIQPVRCDAYRVCARCRRTHMTGVYVKEGDKWMWAFGFNSPN